MRVHHTVQATVWPSGVTPPVTFEPMNPAPPVTGTCMGSFLAATSLPSGSVAAPADVCERCGSSTAVQPVTYLDADNRPTTRVLCAECKARFLVRERVRVRGSRQKSSRARRLLMPRDTGLLGVLGRAFIGLAVVTVLTALILAATGRFAESDAAERCRPIPDGIVCTRAG